MRFDTVLTNQEKYLGIMVDSRAHVLKDQMKNSQETSLWYFLPALSENPNLLYVTKVQYLFHSKAHSILVKPWKGKNYAEIPSFSLY